MRFLNLTRGGCGLHPWDAQRPLSTVAITTERLPDYLSGEELVDTRQMNPYQSLQWIFATRRAWSSLGLERSRPDHLTMVEVSTSRHRLWVAP